GNAPIVASLPDTDADSAKSPTTGRLPTFTAPPRPLHERAMTSFGVAAVTVVSRPERVIVSAALVAADTKAQYPSAAPNAEASPNPRKHCDELVVETDTEHRSASGSAASA